MYQYRATATVEVVNEKTWETVYVTEQMAAGLHNKIICKKTVASVDKDTAGPRFSILSCH